MGREKVKVTDKGGVQTVNFLCDSLENLFKNKVEFVFAEIWNPARVIFPQFCQS